MIQFGLIRYNFVQYACNFIESDYACIVRKIRLNHKHSFFKLARSVGSYHLRTNSGRAFFL